MVSAAWASSPGALVGMAAHLDGKVFSTLDMTGLAQNMVLFSHLRIADRPEDIHAARLRPVGPRHDRW